MPTYLEIVVNVPQVEGVFHYHLPPELEGQVLPGHLVEVPFGRQRVQGVVIKQVEHPSVTETRAVRGLIDGSVVVTPDQMALAEYLADSTLAPLSTCVSLMLPVGLSQMGDTEYALAESAARSKPGSTTDLQRRLLDLLTKRGALTGRQIDRALPRVRWRSSARVLIRQKRITSLPVLPAPKVQSKSVRTVRLAYSPEHTAASMHDLGRAGSQAPERRKAILQYLIEETGPVDVSWVYAASGGNLQDLRFLAERDLVVLGESEIWRDPLEGMAFVSKEAPTLTEDQLKVWTEILENLQKSKGGQRVKPILLHGVTGSGKTEIYLRAVNEVIRRGHDPAAWGYRIGKDRNLPASGKRGHPARPTSDHPGPGDRADAADCAAFPGSLSWAGWISTFETLHRGTLRYLAQGSPGRPGGGRWSTLCFVYPFP